MQHSRIVDCELLKGIPLFGALSQGSLEQLARKLSIETLQPGEFAFKEGEIGDELFILLEGEMEVLKQSHRGDFARVALLGPGDWFGEMSVIDIQPRSASVRALADSRLLSVSVAALEELHDCDIKAYAGVVLNLAREMSRRLRVADSLLADFVTNVVHRERPAAS